MNLNVLPIPQKISFESGHFDLPEQLKIKFLMKNEENTDLYKELIDRSLERYGSGSLMVSQNSDEKSDLEFRISSEFEGKEQIPPDISDQSYFLEIAPDKISVISSAETGLLYGLMTLIQILDNNPDDKLICVKILDYPDLKIRGISDDISRGQVSTLENFKRIIEHLARYKMNTYMPYIEDVIEFESYPSIGTNRGALTKEEIREIIRFAARYHVEVIPIFQTLGHYENILSQDEFIGYAEFPGAASLDVSNDSTYEFLETLLEEIFELFPSKYFHMGADESWDVGLGNSRALVDQTDLATVHLNHYKRVYEICKKHDKEVLMYGDIILNHPEILDGLPKDITIVDWHYGVNFDYVSASKFSEAGFNYFVSPSVWNFLTTFPTNINAVPNIKYMVESGLNNRAGGMINSNWGDYGAETFKELVLFGYAWSAQTSWNFEASNEGAFIRAYFKDFFGVDDPRPADIYIALSHPLSQMMWHEVWRHPLLKFREPVWWEPRISPAARISHVKTVIPAIKKELEDLKSVVKKNKEHLEILEFLCDFDIWYIDKIEIQNRLHRFLPENKDENAAGISLRENNKGDLISRIEDNVARISDLSGRYSGIWRAYYKPENLNMIQDKFDRLISYFNEIKNDLQNDRMKDPRIISKWIYYSAGDTTSKAKFRKSFTLDSLKENSYMQLLGDTHARVYINGTFAGEVHARRSLSLLVDYKRILFKNIKEYLNLGENVIEVIVGNYNRNGNAGFNLITNIESNAGTLMSEESWEVSSLYNGDENIKESEAGEYPFTVISPNFETMRTSWIER